MKKTIAAGALAGAAVLSLAACGSSAAAPSSATSARPTISAASPAETATSESNCSVDCVDPGASGTNAWYAQVQGPLQQVSQDLSQIASDASSNPVELTVDGAQLSQDAQAVLNEENDPAPVDNSDFVAAMNDYIAAGNDYSGDNSSGEQNIAQANQEIGEGDTALSSFQAAIEGSSASAVPATTAPASSAPAASTTPTVAATASCGSQMKLWYIQDGGKNQIAVDHGSWTYITVTATTVADIHAEAQGLLGAALAGARGGPPACDTVAAHAWATAMAYLSKAATLEKSATTVAPIPAAVQDANAGFAALATVTAEGNKYAAQP
jgi:hypothetical protein